MPVVKHITSRENSFFKELKKLSGSARHRRTVRQTLLDGIHLVQAYMDCGNPPHHVLLTETALQHPEVIALLKKFPDVPRTQMTDSLFAELSELTTPAGIIALIEPPAPKVSATHSKFCLLLEDIQDPGNLGALLRSAAAAGCDAVFLSKGCADAWSPKVLRGGMGGHFALSVHERVDLLAIAAEFPGRLLAASLHAKTSLYECNLGGKLAFAVGNEGAGLSPTLLAVVNQQLVIPMPGKMESLNVAAAASICLFEAVRQRR